MPFVHHSENGAGRPLILIHGYCENHEIWSHFSALLAQNFKVITPDLPGFGKSPMPGVPLSIDAIGTDMLEWSRQWEQPVVIGHSLGGYVTLAMVNQEPSLFPGFGLFHSTAYPDPVEKKANRNKVIDFVMRNGVAPFIDSFVLGLFYQKENQFLPEANRIAAQTSPEALVAYAAAMRDRPSYESVLKNFTKPILFIAGEKDSNIPTEQVLAQSKTARLPVFHVLNDVGHMGMFENEPESHKIVTNFSVECQNFLT
jgi:pimeloyl-ACP methyl ester carboxylesterase